MIRAVLFDLDGTLLDTAPDLVGALNHVREAEGLPAVDVAEFSRYASRGARGLLEAGYPEVDGHEIEQRIPAFLDHYAKHSWVDTKPFDGVENLLSALEARGIPWGIVTNKVERLTLPIVAQAGWKARAAVVVCGDSAARSKPHPDPLLLACAALGLPPTEVLYFGDDERDLQAGIAAGCPVALAEYGYGAGDVSDALRRAGASLAAPGEVLALIDPSAAVRGQA